MSGVGLSAAEFARYIDYIADRRLAGVGIEPLTGGIENPLPWLAELMDVRRGSWSAGTEYQQSSSLALVADDEL